MPVRRSPVSRWRRRTAAGVLVVLAAAGLTATVPGTAAAAADPPLRIGTLNTDLQPWLTNRQAVVDAVAATDVDVLGLQGVWTESAKDAILADPRIRQKYPNSHYVPSSQLRSGCPPLIPLSEQEAFIDGLVRNGVPTTQYEQPTVPVPFEVTIFEVSLALLSQPCLASLINAMQELPPAADPRQAIAIAAAQQAPQYAHGGSVGHLVLSRRPITGAYDISPVTYQIRRTTVFVTVAGMKIAFADWPLNVLENIDPVLAPLQDNALQDDFAEIVLQERPDVLAGTVNSAPGFQSEGYDLLVQDGYAPQFDRPTYCPVPSHDDFATCKVRAGYHLKPANLGLDNIFAPATTRCVQPATFATTPVSDHIGLAATCVKDAAPDAREDGYDVVTGATLTVPAPGVLANDLALPDERVTVAAGTGPAHAQSFTLNPDGSFSYTPVPGYVGTDTFTYRARLKDLVSAPATATITVKPGAPAAVVATSGSGQAQTAGQPFGAPLRATVTDAWNNPVPGAPVTFTVSSGSATFPGPSATATVVADSAGVATSPALTAGRTSGPVTVTVTSGAATPATFTGMVLAASAARADLQVKLTAPATVARNSTFTATLTVKNAGPNAASNLLSTLGTGNGLTITAAPGATLRPGVALYPSAGLASGATLTYTVTLRAGARPVARTGLLAASLSAVPDPKLATNLALAQIRIT